MKQEQKYLQTLLHGLAIGTVAAATIVVTDSVLTRLPSVGRSRPLRTVFRLSLGGAAASVGSMAGARPEVIDGIIAGVVSVSIIDTVVGVVGNRRIDPPTESALGLGNPWAPQPAHALGRLT